LQVIRNEFPGVDYRLIVEPQARVPATQSQMGLALDFSLEIDIVVASELDLDIPVVRFDVRTGGTGFGGNGLDQ
jgi:hypothetical protein